MMRRSSGGVSSMTGAAAMTASNPNNKSPSDAALFLQSLQDPEVIERVLATIHNAHVFKLPPKSSAAVGWRGADWKEKVWQGTVKVVERGNLTAVLLVDDKNGQNQHHHTSHRTGGSIFAVCPVKDGAVDRCVDSSRYFVLRIENANGRHMFIGVAFNERNDSFDFYTALEDSRLEKQREQARVANSARRQAEPPKDYSIKDGQKIKVTIPRNGGGTGGNNNNSGRERNKTSGTSSGFLRPSTRDTPGRRAVEETPAAKPQLEKFLNTKDPFAAETFDTGNNYFASGFDDQSTGSGNPFFRDTDNSNTYFDPRQYKTEQGR